MRGLNHGEDFGWSNATRFGGGGGGGTTSTNTIQSTTPWIGQQGPLNQIYNTAELLNQQGSFPQYFPGNTYAGMTATQQLAQGNLIGYSTGGGPSIQAAGANVQQALAPGATAQTQGTFDNANTAINSQLDPSGINQAQGAFGNSLNFLSNNLGTGETAPAGTTFGSANNFLSNMFSPGYGSGAASNMTGANSYLGSVLAPSYNQDTVGNFNASNAGLANEMSSSFLDPNNSPAYQTAVSNAITAAAPQATAGFVNGNRSGGGLATAAASSAAANAAGGLAQQQYNQNLGIQNSAIQQAQAAEVARQQQQAGAAAQAQGTSLATTGQQQTAANQAASNLLGLQGQQQQSASLANTALTGQQQQQAGAASLASNNLLTQQGNQTRDLLAAPIIDQTAVSNMGTGLSAAGMTQQDQQNALNAQIASFNYGQMQPWNDLGLFENAVVGTGSPGSSGTSTSTQPYYTNPTANVASLASMGALGIGAASAAAQAAGYSGLIMGATPLLGFSDRDLKTDIHKVGQSDSGFPLYTFRYKWEGPMSQHIGVMAQDVEPHRPHAVINTPFGKMVDYMEALAA